MSQISETRREQIVQTARRIVDEQGPNHLTAEAITHKVGVSRPLLYHYYTNMNDLLDAVIALYVDEFEERLSSWEASFDPTAATDTAAWARALVGVVREPLASGCPLLRGTETAATSPSYPLFLARCADVTADHALEGHSEALAPCLRAANPREALHFAFLGLAGMLRSFPETSDEAVADMLAPLWGDLSADEGPSTPEAKPGDRTAPATEGGRKGLFGWIFN